MVCARRLFAALAAGCVVAVGIAAAAPAASTGPPASSVRTVFLPDGTVVALPDRELSLADLASFGIAVGKHGIQAATTTVQSTPPQVVQNAASSPFAWSALVVPNTALDKCNVDVCEDVYGTGLTVTGWTAWTTVAYDTCTYAVFWEPINTIWALGQVICANGYFYAGVSGGLPHNFANQSQACASWLVIPGKPCATIHT